MNIWIEKTIVDGRKDRIEGSRALGKALWSPQKAKGGADIYKNMRLVERGDLVIHLVDNEKFSGVSIVKREFVETNGLKGTEWDGPAYLIELRGYVSLPYEVNRIDLLTKGNERKLLKISDDSEVFFNSDLNLRQGAYLTPCPLDLFDLINKAYLKLSKKNLPYFEKIDLSERTQGELVGSQLLVKLKDSLLGVGYQSNDELIVRFVCSLLTKPFVILTGLSGSGKTKLAQAFSKWICQDSSQVCIVPVGADWTNREPLMGYPNALESGKYVLPDSGVLDLILRAIKPENEKKPHFLILDEMNLSHVERYFADFLSAIESEEYISLHPDTDLWKTCEIPAKIKLPGNLFIIGTVNIDETTYMFSPKVLDRANVIEFRVTESEMNSYLDQAKKLDLDKLSGLGSGMAEEFVTMANDKTITPAEPEKTKEILMQFFNELKKIGVEFGYRTASEILRFSAMANRIEPEWGHGDIIDASIMQKLLPKVHGSRRKLSDDLKILGNLCLMPGQNFDEVFKSPPADFNDKSKFRYPLSLEKIIRMYRNLIDNGFTSYAEA